jgi:hypothetical protein
MMYAGTPSLSAAGLDDVDLAHLGAKASATTSNDYTVLPLRAARRQTRAGAADRG